MIKTVMALTGASVLSFFTAATVSAAFSSYGFQDDVAEETRTHTGFEGVNLKGSMDVYITEGDYSVRVVADREIISDIETDVEGDTLIIRRKRGVKWRGIRVDRMDVYVSLPDLNHLYLQGSGDMEASGFDVDEAFRLSLQGSGDIDLEDMRFRDLDVRLQGSGDIEVEGRCQKIDVTVQGSGDIEAGELDCEEAEAVVQGSGDLVIRASNRVSASVRGSGDITVLGDPKMIDRMVRGSGDIVVRGR